MAGDRETGELDYVKGVFLIASAVTLWSTGGALIKTTNLSAYQVCFWRSLFSFLVLFMIIKPKEISFSLPNVVASISFGCMLLFFILATKLTTSANAIFLQYTAPLYIVVLSFFLFRELPSKGDMIFLFFCAVGMAVFFLESVSLTGLIGMMWAVASGVAYAVFIVFNKQRKGGHFAEPAMLGTLLSMLVSAGIVVFDSWGDIRGHMHPDVYFGFAVGTSDSILVAFLGVFQMGIPCLIYTKGLLSVTPLEAGVIAMIEPILNPVWAYAFVGETPSVLASVGGLVIILSVFFHTLSNYSRIENQTIG